MLNGRLRPTAECLCLHSAFLIQHSAFPPGPSPCPFPGVRGRGESPVACPGRRAYNRRMSEPMQSTASAPLVVVPSIDLRGGRVVRLKQGDYGRQVTYDVDPLATARSFAEAGARWMHVVDLDGAKEGRPVQTDLIATVIRSTGLKVECGGGVRST